MPYKAADTLEITPVVVKSICTKAAFLQFLKRKEIELAMEQLKGFSLLLLACAEQINYKPMQRSTSGKLNLVGIVE